MILADKVSLIRAGLLAASVVVAAPLGAVPAPAQDAEPKAAQPMLPEQPLTITLSDGKTRSFTVERARTPRQQEVGLMFRTEIPAGYGMLFVWPRPQQTAMWMKNCPVPEDMVFIGPDNRILSIAENTVPFSLAEVSSPGPAKATLELRGGETARLGIEVGDLVSAGDLGPPAS